MTKGVIAGSTLKTIRDRLPLTQSQLAADLGVDVSTVKGWESGRRPLGHARAADVATLRFHLQVLGATPDQLAVLDEATRADWLLERIASNERAHPLAHQVVTRDTNQLLAWPLTGVAPDRLGGRRAQPVLGAGQRAQVYSALRAAVDASLAEPNGPRGALLRRNAYYLLAGDAGSREWLREAATAEKRRMPRLDRWTPEWVLHRSLAVSWAVAGERAPLLSFLNHGMTSDETLSASLNYWAAWCGDDPRTYHSDEFMAGDLGPWHGNVLLTSLTRSLVPTTAYMELGIRSVWALLARRPTLLDDPATATELQQRVTELLATPGEITGAARSDLQQIDYVLKWRR